VGRALTDEHLVMEQGPEAEEEDESDQAHEADEPHPARRAFYSFLCSELLSPSRASCARARVYNARRGVSRVRAFQQEVDRSNDRR